MAVSKARALDPIDVRGMSRITALAATLALIFALCVVFVPRAYGADATKNKPADKADVTTKVKTEVKSEKKATKKKASGKRWLEADPKYGIFFPWYNLSFYVGSAPRSQDPKRVHMHLGRGNQIRTTVVLSDDMADHYLEDVALRSDTMNTLLKKGVLELVGNMAYERWQEALQKAGLKDKLGQKASLSPEEYRALSMETMSALNPGRVFHIQFAADDLVNSWLEKLAKAGDVAALDTGKKLLLINNIIPTRLWHNKLTAELKAGLDKVVAATDEASKKQAALALLQVAGGELYPVRDGKIDVHEFTTIYPVGTAQLFTTHNGKKIPNFPQTGIWPFIPRTKGRGILNKVDYISPNPGYGFIPMFPYQYAGKTFYNSLHNDGMRIELSKGFLPDSWKKMKTEREGKRCQNLWLNSRGPVSHGCTRVPSGLISEMRTMLPSAEKDLDAMVHYRNKPYLYDVFDVDGDGTPEVMGVEYFYNYKVAEPRDPVGIRVMNTREAFYPWLYKDDITIAKDGTVTFKKAQDAQFVGKKAVPGNTYANIKLYEPEFPYDKLQFVKLKKVNFESNKGIEFNREMRRVGVGYKMNKKVLFLE